MKKVGQDIDRFNRLLGKVDDPDLRDRLDRGIQKLFDSYGDEKADEELEDIYNDLHDQLLVGKFRNAIQNVWNDVAEARRRLQAAEACDGHE